MNEGTPTTVKVLTAGDDFESPPEGLSHNLNAAFVKGDENFEKAFTIAEGRRKSRSGAIRWPYLKIA